MSIFSLSPPAVHEQAEGPGSGWVVSPAFGDVFGARALSCAEPRAWSRCHRLQTCQQLGLRLRIITAGASLRSGCTSVFSS